MESQDSPRGEEQARSDSDLGLGIAQPRPPGPVPDHLLLRPIGEGGYGTVWLSRNTMGTYRAVKIVSRKSFVNQAPFERELAGIRNFEPVSRSHEGFVDVLQVGLNVERGYFYYVMELGDDQRSGQAINPATYAPKTLAQEITARGRLSFQECLQLGLALSQALAELHRHGLVHRDIKPSNIIFVNGIPKLADIGLVAEADAAKSFVGTEGFIPPEGPGTIQADVYSLGKVLYECSTGRDRQEFPELPTLLDQLPDCKELLELNEVILQACKNDVSQRYRSAWEMHADLLVLANGQSVRRLKILERRWSKFKRLAGITGLVVLVLGGLAFQAYREWRRTIETRQRQVGASVAFGTRAVESGDRLTALPFFAEALLLDRDNPDHETMHRLRFGSALAQCPRLEHIWYASTELNDPSFHPQAQSVLVNEWFGKALLFDLASGKPLPGPRQFGQGVMRAAYSRDGSRIVTASEDHTARIWRVSDGTEILSLLHPDKVYCANFNPDGSRIVTGGRDNITRVWNLETATIEFTLTNQQDRVNCVNYSPDGRWIVTGGRDNVAWIYNATNGSVVCGPLEHPTWVQSAAFDPASRMLITGCFDHKARVWDVASGKRLFADLNHKSAVSTAEFSPDGRFILTASLDGTAHIWEAGNILGDSGLILRHPTGLTGAAFAPDGRRIVTACTDGAVRVWDLAGSDVPPVCVRRSVCQDGSRFLVVTNGGFQVFETVSGRQISPVVHAGFSLSSAELTRHGRFVLGISRKEPNGPGRSLRTWRAETGEPVGPPLRTTNDWQEAFSSDDGTRAVTIAGNQVQVWDSRAGKALSSPMVHEEWVQSAVFSPDASLLAVASSNTVQVWKAATAVRIFAPLTHPLPVSFIEFSPDGSCLATCCSDMTYNKGFAQVWSALDGKPLGTRLQHSDGVLRAAFSPDGKRVATASEDFSAGIWDAFSGQQIGPLLKHDEKVYSAAFSPENKWVVTASVDKTARIWSADDGEAITPPIRQPARIINACFLAGGRRVVTASAMGDAWVWNLPVDERPAEELLQLAELLSGTRANDSGRGPAPAATEEALWAKLRAKYPGNFTVSPGEIADWHELQARESEAQGLWSAAEFHLSRLASLRPADRDIARRLELAKAQLASHR